LTIDAIADLRLPAASTSSNVIVTGLEMAAGELEVLVLALVLALPPPAQAVTASSAAAAPTAPAAQELRDRTADLSFITK
jgi:hypothetical protein